jgi:flagellar hook protein FlgE
MALQLDSGTIQSAQRRLDVLGNNISNVNTVGFKGASFDALLGSAMAAGGGAVQNFGQGNISTSTNPLDMAINGAGMFKLKSPNGQEVYTRDGQFTLNDQSEVVNSSGDKLLDSSSANLGKPIVIDINKPIDAVPTSTVGLALTLDSRKGVLDSTNFNQNDPTTYTNSTTTAIYGSLNGDKPKNLQTFYVKTSDLTWDVFTAVDGIVSTEKTPLTFDSAGKLSMVGDVAATIQDSNDTSSTPAMINNPEAQISVSVPPSQTVNVDLSGAMAYGSVFSATMSQDGSPAGQVTGYKVGGDGTISAQFSNGRTKTMGELTLFNFKNLQGLQAVGNNKWTYAPAAGQITELKPGVKGMGSIQGLSTEDSNVDLTVEMIKLISAQRAFQAASEVVKKQDEILQGVVHIGQ